MKTYYIYILTNKYHGTLYIGITNDLQRRIQEHKEKLIDGFTKRYDLTKLVFVESFEHIDNALMTEKRLKRWHRSWKISLIEKNNPSWHDLYEQYFINVDPETSSG